MQILLIQEKSEVREKLMFLLESGFGAIVLDTLSIEQANEAMKAKGFVPDLVIMDLPTQTDYSAFALQGLGGEAALALIHDAHKFLIPKGWSEGRRACAVLERARLTALMPKQIDEWIDRGAIVENSTLQSRCRIRTNLLLAVSPLRGDIYIRLSESKYLKLFHQGDVFDRADLEKYTEKKGVEYLYIKKEDCQLFVEKYRSDLEALLKAGPIRIEDATATAQNTHETVQSLVRTVGFTVEVQELVKTQVKVTMKAIASSPKLSDLLAKLDTNKANYVATHSLLAAHLACAIASQMKWGSEATFLKLNLASFLHDITLENQTLATEDSLPRVEKAVDVYTPDEIKAYKNHPIDAAALARRFAEIPPDVDTIIAQHHELPDGSGFPRGIAHTYIAPLTCIFIIAHDLAKFILDHGNQFNAAAFLAEAEPKYRSSQFKKALQVVQSLPTAKLLAA